MEKSGSHSDLSSVNSSSASLSSTNEDLQSSSRYPHHFSSKLEEKGLTLNRRGSNASSSLLKIRSVESARYSVNVIYPQESHQDIELKRVKTTNTILSTISRRVNVVSQVEDEENNINTEIEKKYDTEIYPDSGNLPVKGFGREFSSIDPELVTWDGPDDPEFPRNWPTRVKWGMTVLVSAYTLLCGMGATCLSPAIPTIADDFGITNDSEKALMSSIFVLAWAISPLVLSPLSEMYGRRIILTVCVWMLLVFNICTAFAKNTAQMVCLRFTAGLFALAPLTIGGGVLGDLFDDDHRNLAMGLYSVSPNLGPVLSPIISSWILSVHWRWCIRWYCIVNAAIALLGTFIYKETYSPTLLRQKAAKLRKESGNDHLRTVYDIADGETVFGKFYINITRPLQLLFTHPMVLGLGSFMAFTMGLFFIFSSTYVSLFEDTYGYSVGISGLMWIPMGIGEMLGILFWTSCLDYFYKKLKKLNNGVAKPEFRLPGLIIAGFLIPFGLIIYGWSLRYKVFWFVPVFGAGLFAFTIIAIFQVIQNYLIDMNPRFAASSLAAAATFRSLFGFSFPLFGKQMYLALGWGWGNTLLAFVALLLGVPFPSILFKYGESLRVRTNKRLDKQQAKRDAKNLLRLQKLNAQREEDATTK